MCTNPKRVHFVTQFCGTRLLSHIKIQFCIVMETLQFLHSFIYSRIRVCISNKFLGKFTKLCYESYSSFFLGMMNTRVPYSECYIWVSTSILARWFRYLWNLSLLTLGIGKYLQLHRFESVFNSMSTVMAYNFPSVTLYKSLNPFSNTNNSVGYSSFNLVALEMTF